MAAEPTQDPFQYFLHQRKNIVKDIEQFLLAVLKCCRSIKERIRVRTLTQDVVAGITDRMSRNLPSVIKSLFLLHGLYGYPDSSKRDVAAISIDKGTVRNLVNQLKDNEMSLKDYCAEVINNDFWEFDFGDEVNNLPREPAQVFLNMVRDMLGNTEFSAIIAKSILEELPDKNKLKPKMWAQHKERKECFGVSLGVRSYVRSLFLYTKLSQLREIGDEYTGVRLQDVDAIRHMDIMIPDEKSKYAIPEKPCLSCKIFFDPDGKIIPEHNRFQDYAPFGNCAEYDVIRTENLDYFLASPDVKILWDDVKSACIKQFKAFKELTRKMDRPGRAPRRPPGNAMLRTFYVKTKVLRYKWDISRRDYKLIAEVWPPEINQN